MEIREYKDYNKDEILRLYSEVGWTAYTKNMPVLEQGFKNSLLAMALRSFLFRTFWCFPKNSDRASEPHCLRRFWTDIMMFVKSNWQPIIRPKQ